MLDDASKLPDDPADLKDLVTRLVPAIADARVVIQ
jgi:hypothetical protein